MSRPSWFPELHSDTELEDAQAILECQGGWWVFGSPLCKKPQICISKRVCYFVETAARHEFPMIGIRWIPEFDIEDEAA